MSTLLTFHEKPVNWAPISGLVPPSGGPPHGPPPGAAGHSFPSSHPSVPSGPPSNSGPPVPSPHSGPPIPPTDPPIPHSFSVPCTCPPVASGYAPFLLGINWHEHHVNSAELKAHVVASTHTNHLWTFACPKVGSAVNHGVCFKTFVCTCNACMWAIATQCLGTETMSLKGFLHGFFKL